MGTDTDRPQQGEGGSQPPPPPAPADDCEWMSLLLFLASVCVLSAVVMAGTLYLFG